MSTASVDRSALLDSALLAAFIGAGLAFLFGAAFDGYLDERRARDELRAHVYTAVANVSRISLWPLEDDAIADGSRRAHIDLYTEADAALATFARRAKEEQLLEVPARRDALGAAQTFLDTRVRQVVSNLADPWIDPETETPRSRFYGLREDFRPHRAALLTRVLPDRLSFGAYIMQARPVTLVMVGFFLVLGLLFAINRWRKPRAAPVAAQATARNQ